MSRAKTKDAVVIVDGNELTTHLTNVNRKRGGGTEDNTTFGKDDIVKDPTLGTGEFGFSGKYATKATSGNPRSVLDPLVNTKVNIKYRPEGTGTGLPQDSFDAVITGYEETGEVAGYIGFVCTTEPSDAWDTADQV
jgi:hypothetical protein